MQNNPEKKSGAVKKFLKEKGYYIVLGLCVVAVGVSGFLFVKTAADRSSGAEPAGDATLSVPLTPAGSDSRQPAEDKRPSASASAGTNSGQTTIPSTQPTPREDAAETVAPDVSESAPAPVIIQTVRPLSGETIYDYSVDVLAYNETTQDWRTHNGIDIAAKAGDPVCAARDGTVSAVYEDNAYGTTVVVRHTGGYETHYGNLDADAAVTVGQSVQAGDVLGAVGSSATVELAQAEHLHFSVLCDGAPVNPEAFLAD